MQIMTNPSELGQLAGGSNADVVAQGVLSEPSCCGRCSSSAISRRIHRRGVSVKIVGLNRPPTEAASTLLPSIGRKGLKLTGLF